MSTTTDKTQRMIFLALPFIFVLFVIQFPAGLLVYWITTNVWTIGQQAIIKKRLGPLREQAAAAAKEAKERDQAEATTGKGKGGGKGGGGGRPLGKLSPTAAVAAGEGGAAKGSTSGGPPPAPPRKKKKRSGRRR